MYSPFMSILELKFEVATHFSQDQLWMSLAVCNMQHIHKCMSKRVMIPIKFSHCTRNFCSFQQYLNIMKFLCYAIGESYSYAHLMNQILNSMFMQNSMRAQAYNNANAHALKLNFLASKKSQDSSLTYHRICQMRVCQCEREPFVGFLACYKWCKGILERNNVTPFCKIRKTKRTSQRETWKGTNKVTSE